jgi:small basic protein (TIGR04137 family)
MSIDKSLKRKNTLARSRNVLNRAERIAVLKSEDRWVEGMGPFNLPKVRILKVGKKVKKPESRKCGALVHRHGPHCRRCQLHCLA